MYEILSPSVLSILDDLDREDKERLQNEKTVINVYFSKPIIDDLQNTPVGQPKQKKRFLKS